MNPTDQPIACSLTGASYRQRVGDIHALCARALRASRREGRQLHLTFDAAARADVEEMVRNEQACCAFLDFRVRAHGDVIDVTITAPADAGVDVCMALGTSPNVGCCK